MYFIWSYLPFTSCVFRFSIEQWSCLYHVNYFKLSKKINPYIIFSMAQTFSVDMNERSQWSGLTSSWTARSCEFPSLSLQCQSKNFKLVFAVFLLIGAWQKAKTVLLWVKIMCSKTSTFLPFRLIHCKL